MTKTYKINGKNIGTGESVRYNWTEDDNIRIVEVKRADQTGETDSVIVKITRNTAEECEAELNGQISDGLFENEKVEKVEELPFIKKILGCGLEFNYMEKYTLEELKARVSIFQDGERKENGSGFEEFIKTASAIDFNENEENHTVAFYI